jgi:hypothetical protein
VCNGIIYKRSEQASMQSLGESGVQRSANPEFDTGAIMTGPGDSSCSKKNGEAAEATLTEMKVQLMKITESP